ncbi:MAG: hypothetical protein KDD40_00870 [Bdellovibrionales bacterium]|nr:hypothetical protein [Bdellovibrionales bacterium]
MELYFDVTDFVKKNENLKRAFSECDAELINFVLEAKSKEIPTSKERINREFVVSLEGDQKPDLSFNTTYSFYEEGRLIGICQGVCG